MFNELTGLAAEKKSRFLSRFFLKTLSFFLLTTQICFGQWVQVGLNDEVIKAIAIRNQNIFAVTADSCFQQGHFSPIKCLGKVYRSIDNGSNWTVIVDSNAVDLGISLSEKVFMVKDSLPTSTWEGKSLFSSTDNGETWLLSNALVQLADSFDCINPYNIIVTPTGNVILTLVYCYAMSAFSGFGLSYDDGLSWYTPGETFAGGYIFDFKNNFIITGGYYRGWTSWGNYISLSSDYGNNWNFLGYTEFPNAIGFFANGNIILGTAGGVHLSEDFCNTWTQIATINLLDLNTRIGIHWSNGSSEGMLIGTEDSGVFLFTDEGDSLGSKNEGLTNLNIHTLSLDNNGYVYAGTENGVWRRPLSELITIVPVELTSFTASANGKEVTLNWSTATELNNQGFEVQRKFGNNNFVTIGSVKGHGTTTSLNNYNYIDKLVDAGKYFYRLKQIDFGGTYEYSQEVEVNWSPFTDYKLEQNYPNQFNATTKIGFGISEKGNVKLSILNILGEEIKVLLSEEKEAGYHSIDFNAGEFPSGVYFYRIQAGNPESSSGQVFLDTKKMILLK